MMPDAMGNWPGNCKVAPCTMPDVMGNWLCFIFSACFIVIIMSTWLDYFPARLSDIKPRSVQSAKVCRVDQDISSLYRVAEGQGIPMACLFLPMVCCAAIFCAMNNATQLLGENDPAAIDDVMMISISAGLLPLYLHILCALSACSVLGTIVHSIPHPNHIVIYNFAIMGIAWAMHIWLKGMVNISLTSSPVFPAVFAWMT